MVTTRPACSPNLTRARVRCHSRSYSCALGLMPPRRRCTRPSGARTWAGAFSLAAGASAVLEGAHVLLIDDVLTTGATACEAAETLLMSGAARVTLIAYARALPSDRFAAV